MFGTDFPVLTFDCAHAEIETLGLRPDKLRKLLRDDAVRLYELQVVLD